MRHIRSGVLNIVFKLLYGRLVFFHEPAGKVLFGASWHTRRLWCISGLPSDSVVVDVGAGEGRLVRDARRRAIRICGFDPSPQMRRAALRRDVRIARGSSSNLPLAGESVDRLIATYPGPWIATRSTWVEFDRVLARSGDVRILLGGSYDSGPGSRIRSRIVRMAYGFESGGTINLPAAERCGFKISHVPRKDCWGIAHYIIASRRSS